MRVHAAKCGDTSADCGAMLTISSRVCDFVEKRGLDCDMQADALSFQLLVQCSLLCLRGIG